MTSNLKNNSKSKTTPDSFEIDAMSECWRPIPTVDNLSKGDPHLALDSNPSKLSPTPTPVNPLDAKSIGEDVSEERNSIDLEFKELLQINECSQEDNKTDSNDLWDDGIGLESDRVSKLCYFDDNETEATLSRPSTPTEVWVTVQSRSRTSTKTSSVDCVSQASRISLNNKYCDEKPTNLLKLRGLYIGNLKKNFDHKVLRGIFKHYGTIVDFYQPSGEGYAFIHFKAHESATQLMADWQQKPLSECKDDKKLVIRFTASQEQMQKI